MKFHNSEYGLSKISYVETRDMGQLGVLGSYPIHFHVPGNSDGSFATGNSIHRSFNRATLFTAHKESTWVITLPLIHSAMPYTSRMGLYYRRQSRV